MAKLRVLQVSAEVDGLAKTGGLGDAAMALSRGLARAGCEVLLVTARYGPTRVPSGVERWPAPVPVQLGQRREVGVLEWDAEPGLRVCLVEDDGLYGRVGLYGDTHGPFGDNALRFATLSKAALGIATRRFGAPPDVVHGHDWHAALAILYARDDVPAASTVFTIHNLAHQGVFDPSLLWQLGVPPALYRLDVLEEHGGVNLMKGAITMAHAVTTVSPRYAHEIRTPEGGFGLDGHLRYHQEKLVGIVNGIDGAGPRDRTDLPLAYDANAVVEGKSAAKTIVSRELGLDLETPRPLFGTVGRFAEQKGIDVFLRIVPGLVERGANVALVGTGDRHLEELAQGVAARFPGRVAVRIAFDTGLAKRMYAACDFFLVPSRFEPCGLTQMYAMQFGAIPVVSRTGGLVDTVSPIDTATQTGSGFFAEPGDAASLLLACEDAFTLYRDPRSLVRARARAMALDHSWTKSVGEYQALYAGLRAR